ncbi:protein takeout-like [Macrosteles quadrilineatus]|uniref:protein takeout-like n=1 Tax=Macrosteles quadrilineatus TaxID=74068 RepID=UPI0023E33584|nr:protein takeout-like [Macrosteles quadrilineatus]
MVSRGVVVLIISVVALSQAAKKEKKIPNLPLPSYIGQGCKYNDPNINECVVRKGAPAVRQITNGDPKYRIPRLDPLVIESLKVQQGTRQVGLSLECRNCSMYGLQNINFTAARLDLNNSHCEWDFYLEKLFIRGKYNVTGRVLLLPILGDGDANITAIGVRFSYKYDWVLDRKANGLDYVRITSHSLPFTLDRLYISLTNLFNGDRLLGDNMNIFLNDNWQEIMKDLSPALSEALGEVFRQTLTSMADLVPFQTLFPPN